jgi:hypothetical protein
VIEPKAAEWIIGTLGVLYMVARVFHRKESFLWHLQRTFVLLGSYFCMIYTARVFDRPVIESLLWGVVTMLALDNFIPRRRRRPMTAARRKAIARWEKQTGQKFQPGEHEIDHLIPYAKGGDGAAYNLRVLPAKENRSTGKKSPRWDLVGRWRD